LARTSAVALVAAELEQGRALLGRSSMAERVAGILRAHITEGLLLPGTRLPEEAISATLGVSRNTVREAFQLLSHERLLCRHLNRGVFVREFSAGDLVDLYRVRRLLECGALRQAGEPPAQELRDLRAAVESGEAAAHEQRWHDVGTAGLRFHQAIAALAGSARVDEIMQQILAELRLVFAVTKDRHIFYEPYLAPKREILRLLEAGDLDAAERVLDRYLTDAEQQLLQAYARREGTAQ
jgi:DNA-binding GntR family transcriptional regulator